MQSMPRRLFSPEQADRTLPLVRKIVADILRCGQELRSLAMRPEISSTAENESWILKDRLTSCFRELEQIGCSFKDWNFETGLVDFPARIDGRLVLLCWRSDEPRVRWYHSLEGGYAARRPIPDHLLEEDEGERNSKEASVP